MAKIGYVMAYRKGQNNYGTQLQGRALLKKMLQLGHKVEIIDYGRKLTTIEKVRVFWNAYRLGNAKRILKRGRENPAYKDYPEVEQGLLLRTQVVDDYKAKFFFPYFHRYNTYKELRQGSRNYDVVVVGSDQTWLPASLPVRFFNLLFVDDQVRKVAYASSFGVSDIPKFQQKSTGKYLNRFDKIGVREQRGKEIVESLSRQKAKVVADPTLLLSQNEWNNEIETAERESKVFQLLGNEPYIFCYFLTNNNVAVDAVEELQKRTGYKVVCIRHTERNSFHEAHERCGDIAPYDVDPNDFVRLIKNAAYVCTDSFHCSVFSTIFHRQFMTFFRSTDVGKNSKNSRIISLFNVLGINHEHVYDGDIRKIDNKIDWNVVEDSLTKLRVESELFLQSSLKQ